MAKIKKAEYIHDGKVYRTQYLYLCLGCDCAHAFGLISEGGNHDFNMDLENPTVYPSLLQNFTPGKICHSFIKDGMIQYLGDCTHELAGQTVDLPNI